MMKYKIGKFEIDIPNDHMLPVYQSQHLMYDKFLPYLAKKIPYNLNDFICIVGSNVGDTLAALCDVRPEFTYLNFEADSSFFLFLNKNSKIIHEISKTQIINECCLVGKDAKVNYLIGEGGTKHAVFVNNEDLSQINLVSLDTYLQTHIKGRLKLLVVDVDGFDYDVLNSAQEVISNESPLIFFELFTNNLETLSEYISTLELLTSLGYLFSVFDNFGNLILENVNLEIVEDLAKYIFSQNKIATRTIYYIDILASTESERPLASAAILNFRNHFLDFESTSNVEF